MKLGKSYCLLLVLYLINCFYSLKAKLIPHDFKGVSVSSQENNIIKLDNLIDDSTVDIHFQTDCQECECGINSLPGSLTPLDTNTFQNEIMKVFTDKNRIFIFHEGMSKEKYLTLCSVNSEGKIIKIIEESSFPRLNNIQSLIYSEIDRTFIGFSEDSVFMFKISEKGEYQPGKDFSVEGKIFDVALQNNLLFLAKGDLGIEIHSLQSSSLENTKFSPLDLDLGEDAVITKLEVGPKGILYCYFQNKGKTSILALDLSDIKEIKILNIYQISNMDIIDMYQIENEIGVISKKDDKFYFKQFVISDKFKYDNLSLKKNWEFPDIIYHIRKNGKNVLLEGEEYLYILRKNYPHGTSKPELLLNLIKKEKNDHYLPFGEEENTNVISFSKNEFIFHKVIKSSVYVECGKSIATNDNIDFLSVFVYNSSCPEVVLKDETSICLYPYNFTLSFTGESFEGLTPNPHFAKDLTIHKRTDNELLQFYNITKEQPNDPKNTTKPSDPKNTTKPNDPKNTTKPNDPKNTTQPKDPKPSTQNKPNPKQFYEQLEDSYILYAVLIALFVIFVFTLKFLWSYYKRNQKTQFEDEETEEQEFENNETDVEAGVKVSGDKSDGYENVPIEEESSS